MKKRDVMDIESYRSEVLRTTIPDLSEHDKLALGSLGLCGEVGELVDLIKKVMFHKHNFDKHLLCEELGDILWYLTFLSDILEISFEEIINTNVEKLKKRYPDGFSPENSFNRN